MQPWLIWLCASLFYAYQYVLRVIPSVLKTDLTTTFHFDAFLFGQFAGIYYVGYTLAHIPLGLMLDRYGPKWILPSSIFVSVLGMIPLLCSDYWIYPIAGRFILGLGSSCAFIGLVKVVSMTFPHDKFNRMLSLGSIFGLIGGMFAGSPVHYLLHFFGWKTVILISCFLGLILGCIMLAILPSLPNQETQSAKSALISILKNKWVLIVSIAAGFMVGPLEGYADAWVVQSLTHIYALSQTLASHAVSLIYLSFAVGLAGLSYSADKIGLDRTIILSGFGMLISFLALISGILPFWLLPVTLFVLGFFCAYQVPALCRAASFTPSSMNSLTTAVANTIIMLFGMFFHSTIGGCMQYFGNGQGKNCIVDTLTYQKGFFIIPLMLILGIGIFIVVRKRFKQA